MIYYIGEPPQGGSFLYGLYDRIMNLSKLFWEAIDSAAKLDIMVLALRKKEC